MNAHCPECFRQYPASEPHCPHCRPRPVPILAEEVLEPWERVRRPTAQAPYAPELRKPATLPVALIFLLVGLFGGLSVFMGSLVLYGIRVGGGFGPGPKLFFPNPVLVNDGPGPLYPREFGESVPLKNMEAELRPLFLELHRAVQQRNTKRAVALFDLERLNQNIALPDDIWPGKGMCPQVAESLEDHIRQSPNLTSQKLRFRSIRRLPSGDLMVFVDHQEANIYYHARWWLTRSAGRWKFYDMEFVLSPLRLSADLRGQVVFALKRQHTKWFDSLLLVVSSLGRMEKDDLEGAQDQLEIVGGPITFLQAEALRRFAEARLALEQGRHEDALTHIREGERACPDSPVFMLYRGLVLNEQKRWKEAIEELEAYHQLVGPDPMVCYPLGLAYRWLGRFPDAVKVYRQLLDDFPDNSEAVLGLLHSLDASEPRDDVPARFLRLSERAIAFDLMCSELLENNNIVSVRQLCEVMRKASPGLPVLNYYEALLAARSGNPEDAIARFREALRLQRDEDVRQMWRQGFRDAVISAGRPGLAYEFSTNHVEAFQDIARSLVSTRSHGLEELVRVHEARHPNDPLLPLYRGAALAQTFHYEKADAAFTEALKGPVPQEDLALVRADRVIVKYNLGRTLEAYREVGPAKDTFLQLVNLLQFASSDDLAALIDAHAARHPNALELRQARCLLRVRRGEFVRAAEEFSDIYDADPDEQQRSTFASQFLNLMRARGQAVRAYRVAPDAIQAFRTMSYMTSASWYPNLLAEHRKRAPDDPDLPLYEAGLLEAQKDWSGAAALLEREWEHSNADRRRQMDYRLMSALVKSRQFSRAAQHIRQGAMSHSLINALEEEKRGGELVRLGLEFQQLPAQKEWGLQLQAKGWAILGHPERSLKLLAQLRVAPQATWRVNDVLETLARHGAAELAYQDSKGADEQFSTIGLALLRAGQSATLLKLVETHRKAHPASVTADILCYHLYRKRQDARQAEFFYRKIPTDRKLFDDDEDDDGLTWLAVARGWAQKQALAQPYTTWSLAQECIRVGDARQLRQLVVVQRRLNPGTVQPLLWEAEARWLDGDSDGAVRLLLANRSVLERPQNRWLSGRMMVRALLKSGRHNEAQAEITQQQRNNITLAEMEIYLHASLGEPRKCLEVLERSDYPHSVMSTCYSDRDIAPLLRGEAFAELRRLYPEGK